MNYPRPPHIRVTHHHDTLQISWRWSALRTPLEILLALAYVVGAIAWCSFAAGPLGISGLATALLLAFGIAIGYGAFADLINTTTIAVSPQDVVVRHGPLPSSRGRTVKRSAIRQLYGIERDEGTDAPKPRFDLYAQRRDGSRVALLKGLTRAEHALFLEQTIEAALHLPDELVDGELQTTWRQKTPALVVE